jgi:hypothetical protein
MERREFLGLSGKVLAGVMASSVIGNNEASADETRTYFEDGIKITETVIDTPRYENGPVKTFHYTLEKDGEKIESKSIGTRENLEYTGENVFDEPDYVMWHNIKIPSGNEDWTIYEDRRPNKIDRLKESLIYRIENGRERPPSIVGNTLEYIKFHNGHKFNLSMSENSIIYTFNTPEQEVFESDSIGLNIDLLDENQKKLYELVRTTDKNIERLREFDFN